MRTDKSVMDICYSGSRTEQALPVAAPKRTREDWSQLWVLICFENLSLRGFLYRISYATPILLFTCYSLCY